MTQNKLTVIAGKNGCGKSQLLAIAHSHHNTGGRYLQDGGFRTYFAEDRSVVSISGPKRIVHVYSSRIIGKNPDERTAGAYTFGELANLPLRDRYGKFRKVISQLAMRAHGGGAATSTQRELSVVILERLQSAFTQLVPDLYLEIAVDTAKEDVSVFARRRGMPFVRPHDERFGSDLRVPLATLSDGEMNTLFLLYELLHWSYEESTPLLFLIDELESHLHPSLVTRFIGVLQALLPPHAMIVATTHSPLVVCTVSPQSRVLMIHSSEMHATSRSNQLLVASADIAAPRLLYELYGAESAAASYYLAADVQHATTTQLLTYAQEGLADALVLPTSSATDPQRVFLTGLVHARVHAASPIRVLDIGAGHGRLIRGLRSDTRAAAFPVLDIDAIEPNPECRKSLGELARDGHRTVRVMQVFEHLSSVPSREYDLILLHNVVHELPAESLIDAIRVAGSALAVDGVVNVLEQDLLPHGEKRFFVFDSEALANVYTQLGLTTFLSKRISRSGIPIYELTAKRLNTMPVAARDVAGLLMEAVVASIRVNIRLYKHAVDKGTSAIEVAFRSMNIANGELLKEDLERLGAKAVG